MMKIELKWVDEGEWELDFDGQVTLTMDPGGLKELRDLLNKAIEVEEGV